MRITQERVNEITRDAHDNIRIWNYMAGLVGRPDPLANALIQDERQRLINIRAAFAAQQQEDMENARANQNVV